MNDPRRDKQLADLMRLIDVSRQLGATIELDPLLKSIEQAALQVPRAHKRGVQPRHAAGHRG